MLYEYLSLICGFIKIVLYKLLYFYRISFRNIPKMNLNFKIAIKKHCHIQIGKNLRTRNNVSFRIYDKGKIIIGNNCFFNDGCSINCQDQIEIGDNTIFGQNVLIFDHDHDYKKDLSSFITKKITIGSNVWIGANCVILKGVSIGDNTVIAAGTIVNKNIPSNSIVYQRKEMIVKEKLEM